MNTVKKDLYEALLEEFYLNPNFALARTLYLFCQDNMEFPLPLDVEKVFVDGVRSLEVRGFGLTSRKIHSGSTDDDRVKKQMLKKIVRSAGDDSGQTRQQRLLRTLSRGTGKTYTPQMVGRLNSRYKGALSYDDILEIFLIAEHQAE